MFNSKQDFSINNTSFQKAQDITECDSKPNNFTTAEYFTFKKYYARFLFNLSC